jgi:glutamate synthase (NADPH/NADH) small chain
MSYLVQQNRLLGGETVPPQERISAEGRRVLVIGGGDTGSDCVGTALRQGAAGVRQFEILPEPPPQRSPATPWPLWPVMRRDSSSHREGGERRWSVTTLRFEGGGGDDGERVEKAVCADVEWVSPAPGKPPSPRRVPGTEFTVSADLVLLAMGFVGPGRNLLVERLGIALDERGFIRRDANHMTSDTGTFVAGDMTHGASLVVRAIADGQSTAEGVMRYLRAAR